MKLSVTPGHFEEIIKKGYSLDMIFLLRIINENVNINEMLVSSERIKNIYTSLIRKGLITDDGSKLTVNGSELIVFMESKINKKFQKTKASPTEFDEWWKAFPGTDTFTHNGVKFVGSRNLQKSKDDCRIKFEKIILEGDHTAKQLIDALKLDVMQKKDASVRTKTNKLSYMQNSLTYLNQRSYEPFIDLISELEKEIKPIEGVVDI